MKEDYLGLAFREVTVSRFLDALGRLRLYTLGIKGLPLDWEPIHLLLVQ